MTTKTPTQTEGEDRDSVLGAMFALMLERKAREYPDLSSFLEKIGMSIGSYYNLRRGVGNPTVYTIERTAKALGLTPWDMIGVDARVMRAWAAGQDIDLDRVTKRIEERRAAKQEFSLEDFSIRSGEEGGKDGSAAGAQGSEGQALEEASKAEDAIVGKRSSEQGSPARRASARKSRNK